MRAAIPDPPPAVPDAVAELLRTLHRAGGRAWLVGGTVRDLLLGLPPRDFDIATDLHPAAVQAALPGADAAFAQFGTVRVPTPLGPVSVTTLRAESGYRDQRHPDRVAFVADVAVDAARRDFPVNALYLDPLRGELLDPTGGLADLRARRLRTIGAPAARFAEDPLRLLRLWRQAARLAAEVAPDCAAAARAAAPRLHSLSAERVFDELTRGFTGPGRGRALRDLVGLGFAAELLPEVAAMDGVPQPPEYHPEGCVLTHVALVLDHVPEGDAELAWCAVLHDVGKPPTFHRAADRIRFDGHDVRSAAMAEAILHRLHAPRALRDLVVEVSRDHIRFAALPQMRPRRREQWLRSPRFRRHLDFHRADCLGSHGDLSIHAFASAALQALPPEPVVLVTGQDVLALGIAPGPAVGELLAAVHRAADEAPVAWDRATALVHLRDLVERQRQGGAPPAR